MHSALNRENTGQHRGGLLEIRGVMFWYPNMAKPIAVSCPICRGSVTITDFKLAKHTNQSQGGICYGSFMPVFMNSKQRFEAGTLMFIAPKKPPLNTNEDEELEWNDIIGDEFPNDGPVHP